ncbi:MAG: glycosyltransferase family 2 protein [Thioploca sp.]|nr:glycosyltransferase family 2 protein [Thioploca sp.]
MLKSTDTTPLLSIVIPIYNEASNIAPLIREIQGVLEDQVTYEVIGIDDGSCDTTWQNLQEVARNFNKLRIFRHRCSYGQSVAILTGVKAARAEWIVTLDGDGQNDPADILHLVAILQDPASPPRLQMVAGYRKHREDQWIKRLSSQIANRIRCYLLHDDTLDTGCGLKLFSRQAFLALPHFNHMHRFLHALFLRNGGQIISLPVNHRPRMHGQSKYGLFNRLGVGIIDLFGVMWLQRRVCLAELIEDNHE